MHKYGFVKIYSVIRFVWILWSRKMDKYLLYKYKYKFHWIHSHSLSLSLSPPPTFSFKLQYSIRVKLFSVIDVSQLDFHRKNLLYSSFQSVWKNLSISMEIPCITFVRTFVSISLASWYACNNIYICRKRSEKSTDLSVWHSIRKHKHNRSTRTGKNKWFVRNPFFTFISVVLIEYTITRAHTHEEEEERWQLSHAHTNQPTKS